jgi:L-Ala-D/L-Glu epimerase
MRTLDAWHERFALDRPFRISRGTKTQADVVRVTIRADGATGQGEGVPYARYDEGVESVLATIMAARPAIEDGATREELIALMPAGAARNAVDCALWDLEARLGGRSVADMIGTAPPQRLVSALTIGIDTPLAMAAAAGRVAHAPLLKVKVDATIPDAQIRAVRTAAPDATLIVDPNESWDERLMRAMQPILRDCGVALLEQPVPAGADDWLHGFEPAVPVCADEAVHVAADLDRIVGRYSHINIKLDKAGGLTAALALADAAAARGLGLMTGCMICTSLSIAPALHVARRSAFVDLDGPIWLAEDRPGGVQDANGYLLPPQSEFWGSA